MPRRALILGLVAAGVLSLRAATVHTRAGAVHSGKLERVSPSGVRIGGKDFGWPEVRLAKLAEASGAAAGLRNVSTRLLRGIYPEIPAFNDFEKGTADNKRRQYITTAGLGNNPGAILFEGELHVPRAGAYQFQLETDDGGRLFIDDREIAATPAEFSLRRTTATVQLRPGKNAFRLDYLNLASHAILNLHWSGPGLDPAPLTFHLSAGRQAPAPEAVISTAGALAWDGSFIAHPVASLNGSRVRFAGEPPGIRLATLNAAAIIFEPISLAQAARFQGGKSGRKGVLLQNGDFFEGEIQSITNSMVNLKTLLFGRKSLRVGSEVVAAFLQKPATPKVRWTLRTTSGHALKMRELKWEKGVIVSSRAPFDDMRVKPAEIAAIEYGAKADPIQSAWAKWGNMDAAERQAARARQGDFANRFRGRASAWAERARFEQHLEGLGEQIDIARKAEADALQVLAKAEADVRAAHAAHALAQTLYTEALVKRDASVHRFNARTSEHNVKNGRATAGANLVKTLDVHDKAARVAESKALAVMKSNYAKQIAEAGKAEATAKAAFDKARAVFKGDFGPVEKTALVDAARRVRDLAEARRAAAQRQAIDARTLRDTARNELNAANTALATAQRNRDTHKATFTRAAANEAKIQKDQQQTAARRLKLARDTLAKAESAFAEANELVIQFTQPRNDSKAILTSLDTHVRNMETNRRQMQSRLRQVEDIDRRSQAATAKAKSAISAARTALDRIINQTELPALKMKRDLDARLAKLAPQVKAKPADKDLAGQLKQLETKAAAAGEILNKARESLAKPTDTFQKAINTHALASVKSAYTRSEVVKRKADLALLEQQLARKKLEAGAARKLAEDLARQYIERTGAMTRAKQAADRARANLNRYNGEANRANSILGNARNATLQAANRLGQFLPPLETAATVLDEKKKTLAAREQELTRRNTVLQQATVTKAGAEQKLQAAEAAKKSLAKPLDGPQQNLAGLRNTHLQAIAGLENLREDSTREIALLTARAKISTLIRLQKNQAGQAAATRAAAELAAAKTALANAEKAKLASEELVKITQAEIVAKQKLHAEQLKALSAAGTTLRTVSASLWSLRRQQSDADYSLARHRLTHRALLAQP